MTTKNETLRRKESQDSGLAVEEFDNLKLGKQTSENEFIPFRRNESCTSLLSAAESQISQSSMCTLYSGQIGKTRKNSFKKTASTEKNVNASKKIYHSNNNNNNYFFAPPNMSLVGPNNSFIRQTFVPTQQIFPKDVKNPTIKYKRNELLAVYWQMMSQIGMYTNLVVENKTPKNQEDSEESTQNTSTTATVPVPTSGYNGYREIIEKLPQIVGVTCDLDLIETLRKNKANNKRNNVNNRKQ